MNISDFFSKVASEYPILVIAELLALLTLAGLAALFRQLLRPLAERYWNAYRSSRISYLEARLSWLDDLEKNRSKNIIDLIRHGITMLYHTIMAIGLSNLIFLLITLRGNDKVLFILTQFLLIFTLRYGYRCYKQVDIFTMLFNPDLHKDAYRRRLYKLTRR